MFLEPSLTPFEYSERATRKSRIEGILETVHELRSDRFRVCFRDLDCEMLVHFDGFASAKKLSSDKDVQRVVAGFIERD